MPSSYTASARFTLQATGENNNTWGVILNKGVFQLVDDNINGRLAFNLSGLRCWTSALGATDEARMAFLDVGGGSGGTVTIPAVSKGYFVRNGATGDVTISAGGSGSGLFQSGDAGPVFSDGANVYGVQLGGLSLRDYIAAQVTGGGNLPNPGGSLNRALVVRDHGSGPFWTPDLITAEVLGPGAALTNLGFQPANRAGDTFTGDVNFLQRIYVNGNRMQLYSDAATYSRLYFDAANGAFEQQDWATNSHAWFFANQAVMYLNPLGDLRISGQLLPGSIPSCRVKGAASLAAGVEAWRGAGDEVVVMGASRRTGSVTGAKLAPGAAVANIGYTPANKAGDTFTGNVAVGALSIGPAVGGPMQLYADPTNYSNISFDQASGYYLRYAITTHVLTYTAIRN